ncbi:MAG: RloB domain-containing protein [Methylococcaceae bacterium]|nr:RloB domain-containing protein [Methylococcaceae bacterium]
MIYCEGERREADYFNYFSEISSKIKLEIESPENGGDSSPTGLLTKALTQLESPKPKYELLAEDEVWFVIDTDSWGEKINDLRQHCVNKLNWKVAQSNPCFEIWLYYHFKEFEAFTDMEVSKNWKSFLNEQVAGGFDSRKHPVLIKTAIKNAKNKFIAENEAMNIGCTEVFKLSESFYPLVHKKIEDALSKIDT